MTLIGMPRKFLLSCKNTFSISLNGGSSISRMSSKRCFSVASCCSKHGSGCSCGHISAIGNGAGAKGMGSHSNSINCIRWFGNGRPESSSLGKKSNPVSALIKQLDQEMKFEADEHEYRKEITTASQTLPDELAQLLEGTGFQLTSKPGESVVFLQKEFDNEIIRVEFDVEQVYTNNPYEMDQELENEETPEEGAQVVSYQLNVTVERKDTKEALKADVWLHDDYCELHGLRFVPANKIRELETQQPGTKRFFTGPSVEDLDEGLQEALTGYIVSKGIDDSLYEFLTSYSNFKESAEYYQWCQNVKKFLSKSN